MGLMDKFKNLFTEEVEDEEPIKKEVMQVEIPAPKRKKEETATETLEEKEKIIEPKKEEYQFPFFDDDDFHTLERKEEKPKEKKKSSYQKSSYKRETKERYNPPKEEKKAFRPTPIISPVYGILDKNYQKEDIKSKGTKLRSYYNPKEATVDEIRNKAYGTLEDDIETTLFGKDPEPLEETKQAIENIAEDIELSEDIADAIETKEKPKHLSDEDITDLLEAELSKEDTKENEKPRKISDSELFSMIDSMYQKGDKK